MNLVILFTILCLIKNLFLKRLLYGQLNMVKINKELIAYARGEK